MSNRVRNFVLLTLTVGLATATPAASAAAHRHETRRGHPKVERFRELGRRDRAIFAWNDRRPGVGPASGRGSRVLPAEAMFPGLSAWTGPFGFGSALIGSAPVGNGPDFTAVDPATHTLYVTNGFNEDGNPDGG